MNGEGNDDKKVIESFYEKSYDGFEIVIVVLCDFYCVRFMFECSSYWRFFYEFCEIF